MGLCVGFLVTNYHTLGGLKQQKCVLSSFRGQKSLISHTRLRPSRAISRLSCICLDKKCVLLFSYVATNVFGPKLMELNFPLQLRY